MGFSEITKKWQKLSKRVMIIGVAIGIAICIAMFTVLGVSMNKESVSTMNEMGSILMAGVGRQSTLRYNAVIEQRISMVDGLRKTWVKDKNSGDIDEIELRRAAEARDFTYLGFLLPNGELQMIYGYVENENDATKTTVQDLRPLDEDVYGAFKTSLQNGHPKAVVLNGFDGTGDDAKIIDPSVVMIGVPTENRDDYTALVAGLKNTTIVSMLQETNSDNSEAERFDTHIIIKNGAMIMRNETDSSEKANKYYDEVIDKFDMSESDKDALWQQLSDKMTEMSQDTTGNKYFSSVVTTNSSRKHMYCQKLDNSEWFLVTVMEYADLDGIVGRLSNKWTGFTIGACAVILAIMAIIFGIYLYLNKRTLQQLDEAREIAEEANKAKSDFLSNMSHDIRTPMNAIVGMTAIATANINDTEQVANCLKKISLSSRHLLGLINDVLDMSKIESGKMTLNMEELSLSEVVESISTIIQPQIKIKKQNFDIYVHDIISEKVYCDSVRLNQVLLNLLSNAYKFTPENGKIELSLYQEESPLGEHYARTHIIVQDNGIGMSEEFQKKIFESFTREDSTRVHKTEGTGLGMSITKYIIDSMHGTIDVKSKQGEGTRFHIVVDLEIAETEEIDMVLPEWRMLVVDDDQMLCDTTVASLASIGVKADSTLNGESAIQKAVEAHNAGKNYDIILMDWKLPGIDGIETARRLHKKLGNNIPILLISAYDWSEIEDEARAAGISGFISKPLFKSTLFYGLRKFTDNTPDSEAAKEQDKKDVNLEGKRILVAEDNDLNWEIAELLLTSEGFEVEHAENGQICVDKLLANKVGYYDAILMDVRMPVMNGLEATTVIRGLKKGYNKIPIIAMTADAFAEDMQKCLECGMNAHIAKPIDIDVVKATLAKYIK